MHGGPPLYSALVGFLILLMWVCGWLLMVRILRKRKLFSVLSAHAIGLTSGFVIAFGLLFTVFLAGTIGHKGARFVAILYGFLGFLMTLLLYRLGSSDPSSPSEDKAAKDTVPAFAGLAASSSSMSAKALSPALEARLADYRRQALSLSERARDLPERLAAPSLSIFRTTEKILGCMRTDPVDVEPGEKFLARYLPAASSIIDDYIRLSREGADYEKVAEVLKKSEEMLQRLNEAFRAEHDSLLRNDTLNLLVQLEVLDRQLKLDGR